MDEYIRLDTTIINIDNLISKASTAEEANALFKAKDVIYSQKRHSTYRQPVKYGRWIENSDPGQNINEHYMCSECGCTFHNWANDNYCPHCGSYNGMDGDSDGENQDKRSTERT